MKMWLSLVLFPADTERLIGFTMSPCPWIDQPHVQTLGLHPGLCYDQTEPQSLLSLRWFSGTLHFGLMLREPNTNRSEQSSLRETSWRVWSSSCGSQRHKVQRTKFSLSHDWTVRVAVYHLHTVCLYYSLSHLLWLEREMQKCNPKTKHKSDSQWNHQIHNCYSLSSKSKTFSKFFKYTDLI